MKITLVYLAIDCSRDMGYSYGLGYIAAILKSGGHDVDYVALKEKKQISRLIESVRVRKPGIVALSATTSQMNFVNDLARKIKSVSSSFVICGGVHTTLRPECILEFPELCAIARGEGEYPLLELADALENNANYLNIRNLWFRENDKVIRNEVRPLIRNLDELPFPDKNCLDYQYVIDQGHKSARFIFSRGCTFDCSYCSNKALSGVYPDSHHYFRQRSPEKAMEEIELDARKFDFDFITFDDDTISLNKKWFYDFFLLYKQTFNFPFRCNLRVGTVNEDMMAFLKEAGATKIGIGIEHGNEEFRRTVLKRNISNKQIVDTFKLCDRYGISHEDFIMVGFPFENKKLFLDTVRLCRKVSAKGPVRIFQPYPGTELGRICEKNNWLPDKKFFIEREEAVIGYPGFTKEEIQLCYLAFPFLLRYKFIPLNIYMKWVLCVGKLFDMVSRYCFALKRRLGRLHHKIWRYFE